MITTIFITDHQSFRDLKSAAEINTSNCICLIGRLIALHYTCTPFLPILIVKWLCCTCLSRVGDDDAPLVLIQKVVICHRESYLNNARAITKALS